MLWLTILGVLVVIGYYIVLNRRTTRMASTPASRSKFMPVDQARALVDDLIAKREKLFVEPADSAALLPDQLGPTTREFFSRYGAVSTRRGGFRLAAVDVRPSEYARGFLSIGHCEDWDVVQKPGNDEVFVVEGAETRETEMDARFPSVYHLVLDEAQQA
jgi:hypothetical protein